VASFGVPETKEKEDDAPLMYPCKVCGKDIMKKYNVNGNPCYRCCGQFTNPPSVSFKRPKTEHAAAAIDDGMPDTYPCKVCKQPIHKRAGKNGSFYLCCKVFTNPPKPAGANGSAYNNTGKAPRTDNIVKNGRMVPCKVCTNALPERMGKNARSFWLCYVCDQFTYP
jgi:ribosomal protein L37AE/L43A